MELMEKFTLMASVRDNIRDRDNDPATKNNIKMMEFGVPLVAIILNK